MCFVVPLLPESGYARKTLTTCASSTPVNRTLCQSITWWIIMIEGPVPRCPERDPIGLRRLERRRGKQQRKKSLAARSGKSSFLPTRSILQNVSRYGKRVHERSILRVTDHWDNTLLPLMRGGESS